MKQPIGAARPGLADQRVAAVVGFFEQLSSPAALDRLGSIYAADACFRDPFNDVRGVAAIGAIFRHMFDTLQRPHFVINDVIVQQDQCFISWELVFQMRRLGPARQTIVGASHLRFDADGRVSEHRDYWDAAEELYEKLPLTGPLMRWLRRRMAAK